VVAGDGVRLEPSASDTLADRAAHAVREMVHDGVLLPGQPIRQAAIAAQLGISRVPVREALQSLQADGLAEPAPGGGFAVARLSADELSQIYLMRGLLESELLRRIGPVPPAELTALARLHTAMAELIERPTRRLRALNHEFHFRMFRLSGLAHVVDEVARLWDRSAPYRLVYSTERDARARIVAEHGRMLDALRAADPAALVSVMDAHRNASSRDVITVLSRPAPP
jgi:DNA-binding GntR family transcriptional regulator